MSERYKKLTSHGAISIPVAMRRDIGLQGGDPMQVSQEGGRIIIESYVPRCVFCGNTENVIKAENILEPWNWYRIWNLQKSIFRNN